MSGAVDRADEGREVLDEERVVTSHAIVKWAGSSREQSIRELLVDEGISDVTKDKHGDRKSRSMEKGSQCGHHHQNDIKACGIAELCIL